MPELFQYSTGHYIPLTDQFVIGRSLESSYIIEDISISRKHCKFHVVNGIWYITDLSSNGIILNDRKLRPRVPAELKEHDTIEFSCYLFGFKSSREEGTSTEGAEIINLEDSEVMENPIVPSCVNNAVPQVQQPPIVPEQNTADLNIDDELTCSICTELFINAVILNCQHTFCELCIFKWRKNNKNCPICRVNITSQIPSITINNMVNLVIATKSNEERKTRTDIVAARQAEFQETQRTRPATRTTRGRGRAQNNNGRGRGGNRRGTPATARRRGVTETNVIDISSGTDSSSDEYSGSDNFVDGIANYLLGMLGGR